MKKYEHKCIQFNVEGKENKIFSSVLLLKAKMEI